MTQHQSCQVVRPVREGRRRVLVGLLIAVQLLVGTVFLTSGVVTLYAAETNPASVSLGPFRAPISLTVGVAECLMGALCCALVPARGRGVAMIAWCASVVLIRTMLPLEQACHCLEGIGLVGGTKWLFWLAALLIGLGCVMRGKWEHPLLAGLSLTIAALMLLTTGVAVASRSADGKHCPLQVSVEFEPQSGRSGPGRLRVRGNERRTMLIDAVRVSCDCVSIRTFHSFTVAPGAEREIRFQVSHMPTGVEPQFELDLTDVNSGERASCTAILRVGKEE